MEKIRLRVFTVIQLFFALIFPTIVWLMTSCSDGPQSDSTLISSIRKQGVDMRNSNAIAQNGILSAGYLDGTEVLLCKNID